MFRQKSDTELRLADDAKKRWFRFYIIFIPSLIIFLICYGMWNFELVRKELYDSYQERNNEAAKVCQDASERMAKYSEKLAKIGQRCSNSDVIKELL